MRNQSLKNSIFFQFLFSYFAIFLVPFLILSLLILSVFLKNFKEKAREEEKTQILQVIENIDEDWVSMEKLVLSIARNSSFLPEIINKNPYYPIETIRDLAMYRDQNPLFFDILYTTENPEKSYGSSSSYETEKIPHNLYRLEMTEDSLFLQYVKGKKGNASLVVQNIEYLRSDWNKKMLLPVFYTIPLNSLHPYGTLFFLIYPDEIFKDADRFIKRKGGTLQIRDEKASLLYYMDGREKNRPTEKWKELRFSSIENGWEYVWILPIYSGLEEVQSLQKQFLMGILASLVISFGIIYLVMRLNYKPLMIIKKRLEERLVTNLGESEGMEGFNRLVQLILDKNSSLEDLVNNSAGLFMEKLLRGMIQGELDDEMIDQICLRIGRSLEYKNYRVAVISPLSQSGSKQKWLNPAQNYMLENFGNFSESRDDTEIFGCLTYKGSLILVLTEEEPLNWEKYLIELLHELEEFINFPLVCGLGDSCRDRKELFISYGEAYEAVSEKIHNNTQKIIKYSDLPEPSEWSNLSRKELLDELKGHILTGNVQGWEKCMQLLAGRMVQYSGSLTVIRHFLTNLYEYSETALPSLFSKNANLPPLSVINTITSLDEITQILTQLKESVSSLLVNGRDDDLIRGVKKIIENNYSDPNLSVEEISRRLNVSYSYLSRFYKAKTGVGISDFLIRYRIDKFKLLLNESHEPIASLILQVGYRGSYQFGRIFKKYEGLPPSEYRRHLVKQK